MYKLLIVDDEDIEREGMANLINWQEYQTEMIGTAWNGFEALKKIEEEKPDIVLTDVKMPVMDGLELIRRSRGNYPDIVFIVLSGYGEYEFTSQAMEEGIRHYLLKPCDESKIIEVLKKAQKESDEKKAQKMTMHHLLPWAREQIFRNLLLQRGQNQKEYQQFLEELKSEKDEVRLLAVRADTSFDVLEQFILENVIKELAGSKRILLSTVVKNDCVFLMENMEEDAVKKFAAWVSKEFCRLKKGIVSCAVSDKGRTEEISILYEQIQELFRIGSGEKNLQILSKAYYAQQNAQTEAFLNLYAVRQAADYAEILHEVYLIFLKMDFQKVGTEQKKAVIQWMLKVLYGEKALPAYEEGESEEETQWNFLEAVVNRIAEYQYISMDQTKEEQRVKRILLEMFHYIHSPELSLQFLAKEILFMNEDYAGRIFSRSRNMRFSAFLLKQKMALAKELISYDPDIRISFLAEQLGYSYDGQYFSKVFRKEIGMTPSEYREEVKKKSNKDRTSRKFASEFPACSIFRQERMQ